MRLSRIILLCFWLVITITVNAQSRSGRCQVTASWWDPQENLGSGTMQLGIFNPLVAEVSTFKTFKSSGDVIVTVGVEYDPLSEARVREVRLMVAASKTEVERTFGLVGSSEASTAFRRYWNLTVSKRVVVEDKEYTFNLRCWDNVKFPS